MHACDSKKIARKQMWHEPHLNRVLDNRCNAALVLSNGIASPLAGGIASPLAGAAGTSSPSLNTLTDDNGMSMCAGPVCAHKTQ